MKKYKFDVSNVEEFAQNDKRMDFTSNSLEEMKRIENLTAFQINKLKNEHEYPNYFDGGCWIVNISRNNYGEVIKGDIDWIDMGNILKCRNDII